MKSLAIAILGAASFAFSAGCAVAEPADVDLDVDEDVASTPLALGASDENSMYSGVWVLSTSKCSCPKAGEKEYTPECAAHDCMESEVLGLQDCGLAVRATVRYTLGEQHLSAIGFDADLGTWKLDDGEMSLFLESGDSTFKTSCTDEELTLGGDTAKRADLRLWDAVRWAWANDQWIDVPYAAR